MSRCQIALLFHVKQNGLFAVKVSNQCVHEPFSRKQVRPVLDPAAHVDVQSEQNIREPFENASKLAKVIPLMLSVTTSGPFNVNRVATLNIVF